MTELQRKTRVDIGSRPTGFGACALPAFKWKTGFYNDKQSAVELLDAKTALKDLENIRWITGSHPLEALESIDLLCLSGGVPLSNPIVQEAIRRGISISNDTQIFMEKVPCKVIGITGSAGKTTTTTLVGRIAQADTKIPKKAWIGGNIGNPLIVDVDQMSPNDIVVMEISSFQLDQMTISPNIAAVLNITPNHLDRHGTMEAYITAKKRILDFQIGTDLAILNRDDAGSIALKQLCKGQVITFGMQETESEEPQVFVRAQQIIYKDGTEIKKLLRTDEVTLRGNHNLMNVISYMRNLLCLWVQRRIRSQWYYRIQRSSSPPATCAGVQRR